MAGGQPAPEVTGAHLVTQRRPTRDPRVACQHPWEAVGRRPTWDPHVACQHPREAVRSVDQQVGARVKETIAYMDMHVRIEGQMEGHARWSLLTVNADAKPACRERWLGEVRPPHDSHRSSMPGWKPVHGEQQLRSARGHE